jgi:hypothetical protein
MNHRHAEPGGPLERIKLDLAAQHSGMRPTCEVMPNFLSSPRRYAPHPQAPLSRKSPGRRSRECLVRQPDTETDAAQRPTRPTSHLTCERLRDRVAESTAFINLDGSVSHPGCSAAYFSPSPPPSTGHAGRSTQSNNSRGRDAGGGRD